MKFHIRTLGCKMNQLDSGRLRAALISAGHEPVTDESSADYTLVNSCTVTAQADRKSRQAASAASSRSQQVAVLGCSVSSDTETAGVITTGLDRYRHASARGDRQYHRIV